MSGSDPIFSPAALQKAVHDSLTDAYAAIPPGKHAAILFDAATDTKQARVLYVQKFDGDWNVAAQVLYAGNKHVSGKVTVEHTW